jgi:phosphopentomutase
MRALLIVLDSVGIGHAPDAAEYGDEGADTLGHILGRIPSLALPHLDSLGLSRILAGVANHAPPAVSPLLSGAQYGWMRERSSGKDTTTGHWEIAGVILDEPFAVFDEFPSDLISAIETEAGVTFLGNYPQSGTIILDELGAKHLATGKPILYTSADSVLQIAAHEEIIPLERLYEICRIARNHSDALRIGRVIARPFIGKPGEFLRTPNRRDFSFLPPPTILTHLQIHGIPTHSVGKISDIFAAQGIDHSHPTHSNADGMETIDRLWSDPATEGLIFANLVDFDMLYGHRRDPAGYANALAAFDLWLGTFLPRIHPGDLLLITADHGNDPTWNGTDHTRELVPLLLLHGHDSHGLGYRETFADIAATLADYFDVPPWPHGHSALTGD